MRLTIAYSKIKKRNLVLTNNVTQPKRNLIRVTHSTTLKHSGQFQVTVFSQFCYVLLCNHEYIQCLNHRQAKDYITRRNKTERKTVI